MASTQSISVSRFPPARRSGWLHCRLGPASRSTSSSRLEATQGGPHRGDLGGSKMQILIVGIGALGGTIAARALRADCPSGLRLAIPNLRRHCADRACECPASEERSGQTLSTLPQLRTTERETSLT